MAAVLFEGDRQAVRFRHRHIPPWEFVIIDDDDESIVSDVTCPCLDRDDDVNFS